MRGLLGKAIRTVRHFLGLLELQIEGLQEEAASIAATFLCVGALRRRTSGRRPNIRNADMLRLHIAVFWLGDSLEAVDK